MTKNDKKRKKMKSSRPEGPKAGPQGRQLEVGPRRGPRLLVNNIAVLEEPNSHGTNSCSQYILICGSMH